MIIDRISGGREDKFMVEDGICGCDVFRGFLLDIEPSFDEPCTHRT